MYVVGTRVPDFPSSFHIRCRISYAVNHRYQSPLIELPILSWSPLARGFFTGKYTPEIRTDEDMVRVFYNEQNWAKYERAIQLALLLEREVKWNLILVLSVLRYN